jgi:hypothetical protein
VDILISDVVAVAEAFPLPTINYITRLRTGRYRSAEAYLIYGGSQSHGVSRVFLFPFPILVGLRPGLSSHFRMTR